MQYSNGSKWREDFTNFARPMGIKVYDPYHKPFVHEFPEDDDARHMLKHWMETEQYDLVVSRMEPVVECDFRCCYKCDFFVMVIKPEIASWGSADEIYKVVDQNKPFFMVMDDPRGKKATPLWLMGRLKDKHKYIYNSMDEVKETIRAIDSGLIKMNSDSWKLFAPDRR